MPSRSIAEIDQRQGRRAWAARSRSSARTTRARPRSASTRANEMVGEKVAVVIEGWNSPVTLAMQPVLARADIMDITAVSKADPIVAGTVNPYADPPQQLERPGRRGDRRHPGQPPQGQADRLPHAERRLRQRRAGRDRGRAQEDRQAVRGRRHREVPVQADRLPRRAGQRQAGQARCGGRHQRRRILGHAGADPAISPGRHRRHLRRRRRHHPADACSRSPGEATTGVVSADIYFPDLPPFDSNKENLAFIDAFKKAHNEMPDKGDGARAPRRCRSGRAPPTPPRASTARRWPRRSAARRSRARSSATSASSANGQAKHKHTLFKVIDGKTGEARGPEVACPTEANCSRVEGLTVRYGALTALATCTGRSRPARSSASSAPTAPARARASPRVTNAVRRARARAAWPIADVTDVPTHELAGSACAAPSSRTPSSAS